MILSFIKTSHIPCYQKEIPSSYEPSTNQATETILPATKVVPKPARKQTEVMNLA